MILHGNKKKILKDVVSYYVSTTGETYDTFVRTLLNYQCGQLDTSVYSNWLVSESLEILNKNGITIQDCIENKDTLQTVVANDKSREEGEFYTPELWCQEGRKLLKEVVGDKWGSINIWDASAGTGNLMRTENYPADKLFLSSLLDEDVEIMKQQFPGVTVFQSDFVMDLDYDDNNLNFTNKLPERLQQALKNNEPICFYMNPPYRAGVSLDTDVGAFMMANSMGKCSADLLYQFIYRIIMLKRFYNLTDVYIGFFGGPTLYHSSVTTPLYDELRKEFKFMGGMAFPSSDFSNTSETVLWSVVYTMWHSKPEDEVDDARITLTCKTIQDNKVIDVGTRTYERVPEELKLKSWVQARDVERYKMFPCYTSQNPANVLMKMGTNAIGQTMIDNFAIRGTRHCCIINTTTPSGIDITEENFDRVVAAFAIRLCYKRILNAYDNSQYIRTPDTSIEGYDAWLANCLVLFLFDWSNYARSRRNVDMCGDVWSFNNPFFHLSMDTIKSLTTDPVILKDIEENPYDNSFILKKIEEAKPYWTETAWKLYNSCDKYVRSCYQNNVMATINYASDTNVWDASFTHLRRAGGIWSDELEEEYTTNLNNLKTELQSGIYKYGFLEHYNKDINNITVTSEASEFELEETDGTDMEEE